MFLIFPNIELQINEGHSEIFQTSKLESFTKKVNSF